MLDWIVTFFILAIVAGLLGFTGVAALSIEIARTIFVIFIFFFVLSLLLGLVSRRGDL